jgi:Tc5 transposase DNA-binding domain
MATTDPIEAALADLALQESPNYKRTAKKYGVSRTVLSRRHRGLCRSAYKAREFQRLLSTEQEAALINHINKLSEAGIPPTPSMVRVFAFEISQQWPGNHWVSRFVETHKAILKSAYLNVTGWRPV